MIGLCLTQPASTHNAAKSARHGTRANVARSLIAANAVTIGRSCGSGQPWGGPLGDYENVTWSLLLAATHIPGGRPCDLPGLTSAGSEEPAVPAAGGQPH